MKNINNKISDTAKLLKAISDPIRLKMLKLLFQEKKSCVSELSEKLDVSVAVASHHLKLMESAGVLKPERYGKRICYVLSSDDFAKDVLKFISKKYK